MGKRSVQVAGLQLADLRRGKAWSQEWLAEKATCDPTTIKKAEAGGRIYLDVLRRIAEALQVEPKKLIAEANSSEPEREARDQRQRAEMILAYLNGVERSLARNPLLERFARTVDELRVPLRVTSHEPVRDIEEIRAREHFRQTGNSESHRIADGSARRAYAFRGAQIEQNAVLPSRSEPLGDLEPALQTCVLLGDPGSGKTEWLKYRTRVAAREVRRKLEELNVVTDDLCFPAYVRLPDVATELRKETELGLLLVETRCVPSVPSRLSDADIACASILSVLIKHHEFSKRLAPWVWRKMRMNPQPDGATPFLLCLDGWDEIRVGQETLARCLNAFANSTDTRIFLTSRIIGYNHRPLPVENKNEGPRRELRICPFEWNETETFVMDFFRSTPDRGRAMLGELQAKVAMSRMAQNPLLATLMCLAYSPSAHRPPLGFPIRRVELYRRVVEGLLGEWEAIDKGQKPNRELITSKIRLLEEMSFHFFPDEELSSERLHQFLWGEKEGYVRTLDEQDPLRQMLKQTTNASIIEELCRDGVIVPLGESDATSFIFLHLGFQEYFTACRISRLINNGGWQSCAIENADKQSFVNAEDFVDKKAWLPAWQEVIVLLSGKMIDPNPLLVLLANKSRDDYFRHRLTVAVSCLTEVQQERRHSRLANHVGVAAMSFWLKHAHKHTVPAVSHLTLSLPVLVEVSDGVILEILAEALLSRTTNTRHAAVQAIGALGSTAATPRFLSLVTGLLSNNDLDVRYSAVEAIHHIGSAAATPDFLQQLARLLDQENPKILSTCVFAIQAVGNRGNTPEILIGLNKLLDHPDPNLQTIAASAIEALRSGSESARNKHRLTTEKREIAERLEKVFEGFNLETEERNAEEAGTLVTEELFKGFNLDEAERIAEQRATQIMTDVEITSIRSEILARLARLLGDDDPITTKHSRSEGLSEPRSTAPVDHTKLGEQRDRMRRVALEMIADLGEKAATVDFLASLAELLLHRSYKVRRTAAEAVRNIGTKSSTPVICDRIKDLLRDRNWEVKIAAVEAYGAILNGIPDPTALSRLAELLGENDHPFRARLRRISLFARFRKSGQNRYDDMAPNWAAVAEFVDISLARNSTAEVVRQIMASGVRIFKRRSLFGRWEARTVVELSDGGI